VKTAQYDPMMPRFVWRQGGRDKKVPLALRERGIEGVRADDHAIV
jgi:hypothetical protein